MGSVDPNAARQAAQQIVIESRQRIPASLLQVSGRALYSPSATLVSGSPYYFLGVNPGESPDAAHVHSHITVDADLTRMAEECITEHGYLDEQWKTHPPGCAPIQVRGQHLFSLLAGAPRGDGQALLRRTPTSNFILQRSRNVRELEDRTGMNTAQLAQQYWVFHRAVMSRTGCRVAITHAIGIARGLARVMGWGEGSARPSGWGGTLDRCYAWRLPEGPMLLAVPNLSRYSPDGPREPALREFFREFVPSSIDAA